MMATTPKLGTIRVDSASDVHSGRQQRNANAGAVWQQVVPFSLIFLAACWVFFLDLGKFPLFNPDEGLFAEPAREILDTGEWTTSLLNYVVRYTKPPLAMWAMALSYQIFGANEFAARFFGACCAALVVALTYCFLSRYTGTRAALVGSSTLLIAPLFVGTARMAITDMPLTLFFTGSMMCFYRAFAERDGLFRWFGYVLVGLAVMTKGPVAVLIPAVILAAYHILKGDIREALRFYKPLWGALIVGVIALPWFAVEIAVTKGAYFQAFILRENFQRFSSVVDSHKGGWWYHILAMMGGYLPWSVFVPQALYGAFSPSIPRQSAESSNLLLRLQSRFRNLSRTQDLCLFASLWAIITLAFFSASVSKLLTYTLPAFPALAILVGIEIARVIETKALIRLTAPFAVLAIIYGAAGLAFPIALGKLRDCPPQLFKLIGSYVSIQCIATMATLAIAALKRPTAAVAVFAILTLSSSVSFGQQIVGVVSKHWEGALPDYARYAASSNYPILVYDVRKPGIPFYTRKQVIQPSKRPDLESRLAGFERAYVLTKAKNRPYFEALPGCRIVAQEGYVMLVSWTRPANVAPVPLPGYPSPDLSLAN